MKRILVCEAQAEGSSVCEPRPDAESDVWCGHPHA